MVRRSLEFCPFQIDKYLFLRKRRANARLSRKNKAKRWNFVHRSPKESSFWGPLFSPTVQSVSGLCIFFLHRPCLLSRTAFCEGRRERERHFSSLGPRATLRRPSNMHIIRTELDATIAQLSRFEY